MSSPLVRSHAQLPDLDVGGELMARVRAGDVQAFEALFFTYYDRLMSIARRYLRSQEAAEEVVQDAFYRLWEGRSGWVVRTSVRAYLYTAIQHAALNAIRHQRIVTQYANTAKDGGALDLIGAPPNSADAALLEGEVTAALARAVQALPPRAQQAYALRIDHELAYAEIADVMGITVKAVEKLMTRATVALQQALRPYR